MNTFAFPKLVGDNLKELAALVTRASVRPAVAVVLSILAYWALIAIGPWQAWLGAITTLLCAGLVFGVVSPEERSIVFGMLRRRKSKGAGGPSSLPPPDSTVWDTNSSRIYRSLRTYINLIHVPVTPVAMLREEI